MRSWDSTSVYFDIKKKERVTVIGDNLRRILKGKCTSTLEWRCSGTDKVMCEELIVLDHKYYLIKLGRKAEQRNVICFQNIDHLLNKLKGIWLCEEPDTQSWLHLMHNGPVLSKMLKRWKSLWWTKEFNQPNALFDFERGCREEYPPHETAVILNPVEIYKTTLNPLQSVWDYLFYTTGWFEEHSISIYFLCIHCEFLAHNAVTVPHYYRSQNLVSKMYVGSRMRCTLKFWCSDTLDWLFCSISVSWWSHELIVKDAVRKFLLGEFLN